MMQVQAHACCPITGVWLPGAIQAWRPCGDAVGAFTRRVQGGWAE
jgi:hypothetical protein